MNDFSDYNGPVHNSVRNSVKDPQVTRLEDLDPDDFEDPEPEKTNIHPSCEVTKLAAITPGLEETDERGETAFHIIISNEFHIGRNDGCNLLLLGDGKVSRRHARICRSGDDFIIEDNGSSNGTRVNGRKIEFPTPIRSGDKVIVGSHQFTFVLREHQ